MQQSTPEMKTKLLTMDSWTKMSVAQDGIMLLKTICDICHKKDGGADAMTIHYLVWMDKDMFLVHQAPTKPLSSYLSKLSEVALCLLLLWYCVKSSSNVWFRDYHYVFYLEKIIFHLKKVYFNLMSPRICLIVRLITFLDGFSCPTRNVQ